MATAAGRAGNRGRPTGTSLLDSPPVLRLVLPKGSLERATLELFEAADLGVVRSSSVDYKATIDDPRVSEVRILRPQEIPSYVAEGLFDLGITGRDWVEETGERRGQPGRAALLEGHGQPDAGRGRRRRRTPRPRRSRTCPTACGCRPSTPG